MRALLIVNPRATSTTRLRRDVIASALASAVQLEVTETRYRGHATKLASVARSEGYGMVLTLGGDGTVNEAINGILDKFAAGSPSSPSPAELPVLAALPGGSANVFAGALGLPRDPIDATGEILRAITEGRQQTIGLGIADDRYFALNAGLELDARPVVGPVFIGIVSNAAPWTYLGSHEVHANPQAGFESGLDLLALRKLSTLSTFSAIGKMLTADTDRMLRGRNVLAYHDQPCITLRASRPVACQIDGEYVGEREIVTFRSVPDALRVFA